MSTRIVEGVLLGLHAMLLGIGRTVTASRVRMHSHLLAVLWLESLASQGRGARWGRFRSALYPWTWPGESHEGAPFWSGLGLVIGYRACSPGPWGRHPSTFDQLVLQAVVLS